MSSTAKLFHAAKMDNGVPPHFIPQYSRKHPHVAAKNRDEYRKLGMEANMSYIRVLEIGASEKNKDGLIPH